MGLTSWSGNQPRKGDVSIAKNYLSEDEIKALNLIVSAYLDLTELQAIGRKHMYMADWIRKLDDFIKVSDRGDSHPCGDDLAQDGHAQGGSRARGVPRRPAALPQSVDRHFAASLDELKKIERSAKARNKPDRKKSRSK